jgi:DNA repair exonuclease SbcCD ATPase subunit
MSLTSLRASVERVRGRRDAVKERLDEVRMEVSSLEEEETLLDLVVGLFRTLLDQEITEAVKAVEQLQTEGMQTVFTDKDLSVRAEVEIQRGKVAVNLITVETGEGEGPVEETFGGAVQTVQSILMRVIVMYLRGLRPLLILDESLPAFDHGYVVNMGGFLTALCERLNMDVLLVTHNHSLVEAANRAYQIEKKDGEARFIRIDSASPL